MSARCFPMVPIALFAFTAPVIAADCEALAKLSLHATTITLAESAGPTGWPVPVPGAPAQHTPFCRVAATLKPSNDSDIKIEVWMPVSNWNGNFQAVGNGGWSGAIGYSAMAKALESGYATSSTDTGHSGGSARFAMGHPEKLIDFAYRSEHEMTVAAKAILAEFYGKAAHLSYWNGCSAGGKQGLQEAQRYPEDFNGIVAGAPAVNWTGRAAQAVWVAQAVHKDQASFIPPEKYPAIHRAALDACDRLDGVEDGVIENPKLCHFDPQLLLCKGEDGPGCLTQPQIEAARKIYTPSINPRTKQSIYPGLEPGSENGWGTWGGARPLSIATDYFKFVLFANPDWDFNTLDFDRDVTRAVELDHNRLDALNPNLKPFFARGGKLIQYHGWSDPQISPGNSLDYYASVMKELGGPAKTDGSYRLFMVPGMGHCSGGDGASNFDMMSALQKWVEEKRAPEQINASRGRGGKVERTRLLCPYPQTAVYKGSGSTDDSANFVCRNESAKVK